MRLYHFVGPQFGLDDLRRRRLKIATVHELNDPFELFALGFSDPVTRRAFRGFKDNFASRYGLLCFSRQWSNPVQWSHYAEKHSGMCLGFDIPEEYVTPISYTAKRLAITLEHLSGTQEISEPKMLEILSTKFSHWRYEREMRMFLRLEEKDAETGLYFQDFSDRLKLRDVIVGSHSLLTRADISDALGAQSASVKISKARLAFKTFSVVRQRDEKLWQ